ncbi:MAG: GGDEF domain-containing protein [Deferribacterales bacterium]
MTGKHSNTEIKISYSIRKKIAFTYFILAIVPICTVIYLYESRIVKPGQHALTALVLLMIIVLPNVSRLIEYLLIGKSLRQASEFCKNIRKGNYMAYFALPNQREDENAFIDFLRNLKLVGNHIRGQNRMLIKMLNESKDKAQKMQDLAIKDSLTGLYNRRYFDACLLKEAEKLAPKGEYMSLIMLDCDKFKEVNDQYGHASGDKVLRTLADTMLTIVRADKDTAFRFGGDEFGIIMPGADLKAAVKAAGRLRGHYQKKKNFGTSLSISVVSMRMDITMNISNKVEELIIEADKGIYEVKNQGRDGIVSRIIT